MSRAMTAQDACIVMLVRSPDQGSVKTRLAGTVGAKVVLDLYDRFVRDLLETIDAARFNLIICYHPPDAGDGVANWLGEGRRYQAQRGADLGERLANAFKDAFAGGFRRVVVIGSDSPDLPAELIDNALRSLLTADSVIGPAVDGGYYLIGFRSDRFLEATFADIEWGTEGVLARTLDILKGAGQRVYILPRWRDIDTMDDLRAFFIAHRCDPAGVSKTLDYLRTHLEGAVLP